MKASLQRADRPLARPLPSSSAAETENPVMAAHEYLLTEPEQIRDLLAGVRTIAVLGIKTQAQAEQPAFYVPEYLVSAGFEVIPVPVYYPDATHILGRRVYRRLADIPRDVDLINLFRRAKDIPAHIEDILAKKPRAVWMQSGIRNDEAAGTLAEAGIAVVQDRCIMVDHRSIARR
jgi:predicted CoA-binding protein